MDEKLEVKKVAIGSKNPVKIAAVEEAFRAVWPEEEFEFIGVEVPSGVSDQPMSDEESIRGATNRAERAKREVGANFGVGLEGGLQKVGERWFDTGWVVIVDDIGRIGIGSSVRVETPKIMMDFILQGMELGKVCDKLFQKTNTKHGPGYFGLMTNDIVTRKSGFVDGVVMALSRYVHPQFFE